MYIFNLTYDSVDHLDRRSWQRPNHQHRLHEGAVCRFPSVHGQIHSQANTQKGAPQHDIHMPSPKHCRPNVPLSQTEARSEIRSQSDGQSGWRIGGQWWSPAGGRRCEAGLRIGCESQ